MKRILAACGVMAAAVAWSEDRELVAGKRMAACECAPTDATPSEDDGAPCRSCGTRRTRAKADALCVTCARVQDLCEHCGLDTGVPGPRVVLIGTLSLVDKQPRKDMTYYVLTRDDGTAQGIYIDPRKTPECARDGRLLIRAASTEEGAVMIVREAYALGAKEHDLVVEGKATAPVRWTVGGIRSDPVEPVDGVYRITVPAVLETGVLVMGDAVNRVFEFDGKEWKERDR
jgi:hypothetical protein